MLPLGWRRALGALALLLAAPAAHAHELSTSYTTVTVQPSQLLVDVAFRPSDLIKHFQLDGDGDGRLAPAELTAGATAMADYVKEHVGLTANFKPLELAPRGAAFVADGSGGTLARFAFSAKTRRSPGEITLQADFSDRLGDKHVNFVKLISGQEIQQAVLSPEEPRHRFSLGEGVSLAAQAGAFVLLGIEHIFLGYDHILFLLALILLGGRLRDLVKIVSAFTVAHSITLTLAGLGLVALPPRLIESGIAVSIAYVACENFWIRETSHRWILTFFFGLVHGFGFANVLRDLGLPSRGLVTSLLTFNVGVEIGQIAIVGLLFPVTLWLARQTFRRQVVLASSGLILLFGLGWFIERAFGLSFMPL
jgi:hypothetical protein